MLVKAVAYGSSLGSQTDGFQLKLKELGYIPNYKQVKCYKHGNKENRKADWDVGIAIDAVAQKDEYDVLVLGSADGDLAPLIKHLKTVEHKECRIYACNISSELRAIAEFVEITDELNYPTKPMVVRGSRFSNGARCELRANR